MKPKPQQLHSSAVGTAWSCKALRGFLYVHGFGCPSWQGAVGSAFYFGPSHSSPTKLGYDVENVAIWGLSLIKKETGELGFSCCPGSYFREAKRYRTSCLSRVTLSVCDIHMFVSELPAPAGAWWGGIICRFALVL